MLLGTSDVLRGCTAWVVGLIVEGTTTLMMLVVVDEGACVDGACVDVACVVVTATDVVTCLVEAV
jgi:hypothetical protein